MDIPAGLSRRDGKMNPGKGECMDIKSQIELYLVQCGLPFDSATVATVADRLPALLEKLGEDVENPYMDVVYGELVDKLEIVSGALGEAVAQFDGISAKLNEYDFTDGSYDASDALMITRAIYNMAGEGSDLAQRALRRNR
jgi:hypothetical protein